MANHVVRNFLKGQLCFVVGIVICIVLLPKGMTGNNGLTYYGNYARTIVPFALGLLGCAWFTYQSVRLIRLQKQKFLTYILLVLCLLLVGVVLTPYKLNMIFWLTHMYAASLLFGGEYVMLLWLGLISRRDVINIVLIALATVELYLTASSVGPTLGYITLGQLGFQAIFAFVTYRSFKKLFDSPAQQEPKTTVSQSIEAGSSITKWH